MGVLTSLAFLGRGPHIAGLPKSRLQRSKPRPKKKNRPERYGPSLVPRPSTQAPSRRSQYSAILPKSGLALHEHIGTAGAAWLLLFCPSFYFHLYGLQSFNHAVALKCQTSSFTSDEFIDERRATSDECFQSRRFNTILYPHGRVGATGNNTCSGILHSRRQAGLAASCKGGLRYLCSGFLYFVF